MNVYPLKFHPIYKEKIWGGRNLERLFGREFPHTAKIGESWELADLEQGVSVIANGPEAGETLTAVMQRWGGSMFGAPNSHAALPERFPLLLKLLDANDILSLQVHPDSEAVNQIGPEAALKTECWYIVESRDGSIYKGVRADTNPDEFRAAIEMGTVEDVVRRIEVDTGDFHYLPAGTVHAIGAGLVIAEVQTPSDTTYRVTDWNRGREIHVERSMQCIRFDLTGDEPPGTDGDTLLVTDYFTVTKGLGGGLDRAISTPAGRCVAFMFVGGSAAEAGEVRHRGPVEPNVTVHPGETLLLPGGLEGATLTIPDRWVYLSVVLPELG